MIALPFLRRQGVVTLPDIEAASLRSDRFRLSREAEWQRLDQIVTLLEKNRLKRIADDDLMALPALYRQAVSSLAVARETSLDAATLAYLEALVRRAWFQVYGPRVGLDGWLARFLGGGWSRAVRALGGEIAAAFCAMVAGTVVGWLLVARDQDWFYALVPGGLDEVRRPGATRAALAETLSGTASGEGLSVFATFLFSNNSAVAIMAFALGFAFGVPTLLLLVFNTAMLGALMWVFADAGLGWEFAAWLAVHGTTELGAILLAGAAGLHIGRSMAFPGQRAILSAAAESGRRAAQVMAGVVVMLAIAGLLEGFARQLVEQPVARAAIGGAMAVFWLGYFLLPSRRAAHV